MNFQRHPAHPNLVAVNVRSEEAPDKTRSLIVRAGHNFDGMGAVLDIIPEKSTDSTMFIICDFVETSEGSIGDITRMLLKGYSVIGYVDASLLTQVML